MSDIYRSASEPCRPACMSCMTNENMVVDCFIGHWFCKECGWCDCPPIMKMDEDIE